MNADQLAGRRVFVYKNLHNGAWSVRDQETGWVAAHADKVELSDVALKVSQAGRRRVLEEGRKNVHAGVEGTLERVDLRGYPSARTTVTAENTALNPRPASSSSPDSASAASRHPSNLATPQAPPEGELVTYNPFKYSSFVRKSDEHPVFTAARATLDRDGRSLWVVQGS